MKKKETFKSFYFSALVKLLKYQSCFPKFNCNYTNLLHISYTAPTFNSFELPQIQTKV